MWAVLGDIEFEVKYHPGRQDERSAADYAQHALIQGKPRAEWVGDSLDELTLELTLHSMLVDPELQIRRLKAAKSAHEPLPYVLGSGDYRGIYLLTEVSVTTRKTDAEGRLVSATVSINLLEYSGKYTKPLPKPRALVSNLAANPLARIDGATPALVTPTQKVLGLAKTAANYLQAGVEALSFVKNLRDNPLAMLSQAPRLLGLAGQALAPFQGLQSAAAEMLASGADLVTMGNNVASDVRQAVEVVQSLRNNPLALLDQAPQLLGRISQGMPLDGLQSSAVSLLAGGSDLLKLGVDAAGDVQRAVAAFSPVSVESVVGKVDYASSQMQLAVSRLDASSTRLASLAVNVITRRA
ncbi:phage tail protein [Pseudomonas sp. TMP9]|uniref:phage tail protein n=1 Tax=Pseudomonas sp. TMP9 TaxID=3133144 RepID=UPI0030CDFB9E